jgi:hypothetical protein
MSNLSLISRVGLTACMMITLMLGVTFGQSTFGTILGTVRDQSGAVMPGCVVTIENTGTSLRRSTITDEAGSYNVQNLEPATYKLRIELPGFQVAEYVIQLTARQTIRIDGTMKVASATETVSVMADAAPVIATEVSNIAQTQSGVELASLTLSLTARAAGSTSAISAVVGQPGVQTDTTGGISIVGTKPAMLSTSLDGISTLMPRSSTPMSEMFPSNDSIAEIRISEVNNSAEYGGVSDITTISKSGTNAYHGGLFENHINTVLNARNPFNAVRPKTLMNNFGLFVGGPVSFPGVYKGKDKTFFFLAAEGLRLPKEDTRVFSVPSLALRDGDLSAYSTAIKDPNTCTGPNQCQTFQNNQIPSDRISPISKKVLQYFFPLPNTGAPNAIANNYSVNFKTPISSNQGDLRIDRNISSKQTAFARFTWKQRSVLDVPTGSPLLGTFSLPETLWGLTAAHNFVIGPTLLNEVRGGFTERHNGRSFGLSSEQAVNQLGLVGIPQPYSEGSNAPNYDIAGFFATGGSAYSVGRQGTVQFLDNLTWTVNGHTLKFGGDFRYKTGFANNVFGSTRLGRYTFNNSSATSPIIGNAFAAFLLGIPDATRLATVIQPDSDAVAHSFAFYVQDDWKVTPRLTFNYGLRWEYHPTFWDKLLNGTNFLPDYVSIVNGKRVTGAVVISNNDAFKNLNPDFAASIAPTPILTAAQAGIPESLRFSEKNDWAPRFGFAWRPTGSGKTVIRGGLGIFIEAPGGAAVGAAWGVHATNYAIYNQTLQNGFKPTLQFPYPFPSNLAVAGSQDFEQAVDVHYKDPKVDEWNFTIERDLGAGVGLRLTYNGNHGRYLGRQGALGQLPPNTTGFTQNSPLLEFPNWAWINYETNDGRQNYNGLTAVVTKRLSKGLQFTSSYAFVRNLTNAQGFNPNGFAGEAGGQVTDLRDKQIDYGNVQFSRRHRFLTTFLYELPGPKTPVLSQIVGGWQLGGVLLFQSGPFLTVTVPGADPMGSGLPTIKAAERADLIPGVPLYPETKNAQHWINPLAFAVPPSKVGRFPTAPVGNVNGPGTEVISMSITKTVRIREGMQFRVGAQAANLFNHVNLAIPNTTFNTAPFGTISNVQSAEGAGPRQIQITSKLTF